MPDPNVNTLVKMIETLATQKEEVATKLKELVETLDAALRPMGYRVVPEAGGVVTGKRRGRPPGSGQARAATKPQPKAGRKRRRPPMSRAERNVVSRRMKAYWEKRKKVAGRKAK